MGRRDGATEYNARCPIAMRIRPQCWFGWRPGPGSGSGAGLRVLRAGAKSPASGLRRARRSGSYATPGGRPRAARARWRQWASVKKSDPRARSETERPVSWLPAPGLGTTSTIKLGRRQQWPAHTAPRPPLRSSESIPLIWWPAVAARAPGDDHSVHFRSCGADAVWPAWRVAREVPGQ